MFTLNIGESVDCHYRFIQDAIHAVPYHEPALLNIEAGVYEEKLVLEKKHIILQGAGKGRTILRWHDGGNMPHADGKKTGTFRSASLFAAGERVELRDVTIENTAGIGAQVGQALALYVDARTLLCQRVALHGRQDTLFLAPLPETERISGGFYGPRVFSARTQTRASFEDCEISGDIDFIFGGGDALFRDCEIRSLNLNQDINGYVTAPSGAPDGFGLVFQNCRFTSADCARGSVYLGRPWRAGGKTTVLNCSLGAHLHTALWHDWENPQAREKGGFAIDDAQGYQVPDWTRMLTPQETEQMLARIERFVHTL